MRLRIIFSLAFIVLYFILNSVNANELIFNRISKVNNGTIQLERYDPDIDTRVMRLAGHSLLNFRELDSYVNSVLKILLDNSRINSEEVVVRILPDQRFTAYTLQNGSIYISLGAILSLDTEDELASILAHELSHLLLNHHKKNNLSNVTRTLFNLAELYIQTNTSSKSESQHVRLRTANWITDFMLYPSWNRSQEKDADLIGIDLLINAGYNADRFITVLSVMQNSIINEINKHKNNKYFEHRSNDGALKLSIDTDRFVHDRLTAIEQHLSEEYESFDQRKANVREYIRNNYRSRARPSAKRSSYQHALESANKEIEAIKLVHQFERKIHEIGYELAPIENLYPALRQFGINTPYIRMHMFYTNVYRGHADRAYKDLLDSHSSGNAPFLTYKYLADIAYKSENYTESVRRLEEIQSTFDIEEIIYPDLIRAYRAAGMRGKSSSVSLKCLSSLDSKIIRSCASVK